MRRGLERCNQWALVLLTCSTACLAAPPITESPSAGGDEFYGIPLLLQLVLLVFLIGLSGIFCGLTIGVMGLDTLSLEIIASAGGEPDRSYAQVLLPVRKLGHQALATLVLGNMGTNVLIAQLVADITPSSGSDGGEGSSGIVSFVVATLVILIFAEVLPQSICKSSQALFIAAQGVPVLNMFLLLMYPIAKPLGMVLDLITPHDVGQIYSRNELKKLMKVHCETHGERSGLDDTELQLMLGAMEFHEALVCHIMTPYDNMKMVPSDAVIDRQLVSRMWEQGLSRVPVFKGNDRHNIIGILHMKHLISLFDRNATTPAVPVEGEDAKKTTANGSKDDEGDRAVVATSTTVEDALKWFELSTVFVTGDCKVTKLLKIFEQTRVQMAIVCDGIEDPVASPHHSFAGGPLPAPLTKSFTCDAAGEANGRVVLGLVTMEDVIEKLLRSDVRDEYDATSSDSGSEDLESSGSEGDRGEGTSEEPLLEPNQGHPSSADAHLRRPIGPVATAHRKLQLCKPPRRMPAVNFYSFAPHEAFTDAQKWVISEYLRETVPCFSAWKCASIKLLLDLVGDKRFAPPPPKPTAAREGLQQRLVGASNGVSLEGQAMSMETHRRFFEPVVFHGSTAAQVTDSHRKYVDSVPARYVLFRAGRPADFMALILCGGVDVIAQDVAAANEFRSMTTIGEQALDVNSASGKMGAFTPEFSAVVVRPSRIVVIRQRDIAKVDKYVSGLRHHDHQSHSVHNRVASGGGSTAAASGHRRSMQVEDPRGHADDEMMLPILAVS